ncbi:AAA family ATPase [Aeromonas jandaei]|uniref:AAA family ATPase n=1 Tax=Aeromonas jandaei TaxID=650 RepID=A0A7T4ABP6_AERJA|nr:AAA family ATPase [Aeromonas jandaei]QQB20939.1 AAA family ATPase [Aeromonas jandaei]UCA31748.1 AAA family ATPase [Aeromonas jandaei]
MKSQEQITAVLTALEQVILGKPLQLKVALVTLLARGHLLIEDLPGMGKTTLAQALAQVLGLSCRRMQFTADLLPADLLGLQIFDPRQQHFTFHPGPIFTQVLLADEINRASPKVQSALLEAMAEQKVSIEGHTHPLPTPFFVIATQNPADQAGTYPLPESQLDRFAVRLSLGFPPREAERRLLRGQQLSQPLPCLLDADALALLQAEAEAIHLSDATLDYLLALVQQSRFDGELPQPLSPRAAQTLLAVSRAWALVAGRRFVTVEDVQAIFPYVAEHRLRGSFGVQHGEACPLSQRLLASVDPDRP